MEGTNRTWTRLATMGTAMATKTMPGRWMRRGRGERAYRVRKVQVRASGDEEGETNKESPRIAFEPKAKKREPRKRSTADIRTPTKDAAIRKDGEMPIEYQLEAAGVAVLVLLFVAILLGGIFLGASAFLSEELDQIAQDVVYPNYSKLVVAFLLGSTAYGFYKSR
eukprot:scaffold301_cov370-Pavlova_lutheri.AAC.12